MEPVMGYLLVAAGREADFFLQAFKLLLEGLSCYTPHSPGCLGLILWCVSSLLNGGPLMGDTYSILF